MRHLLACLALLAAALPATAQPLEVDVELVLAVDTSRSMDVDELHLQREGYAQALENPAFHRLLDQLLTGRLAITYFDWGGVYSDGLPRIDVVLPWTLIETPEDAQRAAEILRFHPVKNLRGTGISGAITTGVQMIEENGIEGLRRVIDISGDGPNNEGRPVLEARAIATRAGILVNGLPIMIKRPAGQYNIPDLDRYYEDCVITGPGAFVVPVLELDMLADSITRKLVMEIAGLTPPPRLRNAAMTDCLVGEKRRRMRWDN